MTNIFDLNEVARQEAVYLALARFADGARAAGDEFFGRASKERECPIATHMLATFGLAYGQVKVGKYKGSGWAVHLKQDLYGYRDHELSFILPDDLAEMARLIDEDDSYGEYRGLSGTQVIRYLAAARDELVSPWRSLEE